MAHSPSPLPTDPVEAFRGAMLDAGISPPAHIVADGELHRFHVEGDTPGTENGWYVLYVNGHVPAGSFGSWREGDPRDGAKHTWSAKHQNQFSDSEKAQWREQMEQARREREKAEAELHAEAQQGAAEIWEGAASVAPEHPYLKRKGVQPYGIRQSNGRLIVPVRDTKGTLHGLQLIGEDGAAQFAELEEAEK